MKTDIWKDNKSFPEYGRLILFVGASSCHIGTYITVDKWEWLIEYIKSEYMLKKHKPGTWCYLDDLLELSNKVERLESEVSRYKNALASLNTEFKHLIEKCSMLRDMDWVEQYKVATDMADKALKEIDSIKGE